MEETTCQYQNSERIANNPFLKIAMASDPKGSIASKIFPIFPFKTFTNEEIYLPLAFEGFVLKFVNIIIFL